MKCVNSQLEQSNATHTYCKMYLVWPDAYMIKVPKDLLLFNLVNCKIYELVCILTTIIYWNKFQVYEIVILFDIMCWGKYNRNLIKIDKDNFFIGFL